ncbi:MAG TPA: hypothetical protein VF198_00430, partial [Vicinamibacterales bacterium]
MDSQTRQTEERDQISLNAPRVRAALIIGLLLATPAFGAVPDGDESPAATAPTFRLNLESAAATANRDDEPAAPERSSQRETPAGPRVSAGLDGFAIESGDGDFRLQIGLLVHADGRFAVDDEDGQVADTFALKRVRPYLRGR